VSSIKQDVSLAICGHAWHGKSTLLGKVVAESGMATARELEEAKRLAAQGRDHSLVFAQLVFRSKDVHVQDSEAARGITILPSIVRFEFPKHRVTVIDTPGQETYANNRFFGMFQADCAMLVVDCEDGLRPITYQVMRILKGFEIPVHAVAFTKMDRVQFQQSAYESRKDELRKAFDEHQVDHSRAVFIPTSAYAPGRDLHEAGEGISTFKAITWYTGPTLRDFLADLSYERIRPSDEPLRLLIHGSEVYDNVPGIGKTATALVESGTVKPEQTLVFEPLSAEKGRPVTARVRSVQLTKGHIATPGIPIDEGVPRQLLGVALKGLSEKESLRELFKGRGVIAGTEDSPPRVARRLSVELTVFDSETMLNVGQEWTMHAHVDRVALHIDAIRSKLDPAAGGTAWESTVDTMLAPGEWGRVDVTVVTRPVAIEEAGVMPALSKFVLRKDNKAVAYGRVIQILE
jgi:translation elongation factor EF-1alpha